MFDIFKVDFATYNKKKATALVLKISKTSSLINRNKYQMELFILMSKIVVKNINNYLKLAYNSPIKDDSMNAMEMQNEAFLIMINCVSKYKFNEGWCFYFYYNKALSRSFYKMFSETIRKKNNFELIAENIVTRKLKYSSNHYSTDLVISQLGLSSDEILVLNSKLIGQSKQDFLDANKKFPIAKYYKCNQRIKILIQKLLEDGQL